MSDKDFIEDLAIGAVIGHQINKSHQETLDAIAAAGQGKTLYQYRAEQAAQRRAAFQAQQNARRRNS